MLKVLILCFGDCSRKNPTKYSTTEDELNTPDNWSDESKIKRKYQEICSKERTRKLPCVNANRDLFEHLNSVSTKEEEIS